MEGMIGTISPFGASFSECWFHFTQNVHLQSIPAGHNSVTAQLPLSLLTPESEDTGSIDRMAVWAGSWLWQGHESCV